MSGSIAAAHDADERRSERRSAADADPPRPLRVLLVCDHIDHEGALHGAGRQIVELARTLDAARVRPRVLVLRNESEIGRELRSDGLPLRFLGHGRFNPVTLWSLLGEIRDHEADLVHVTDFGAATFGRLAGALAGVPVVVHVRSHHSEHQPRGFPGYVAWCYRALAPLAARAIAISESVRRFAVERMGFRPDQLEVLHNPLAGLSTETPDPKELAELRRSYGIGAEDPVVGCVTRFHAAKGVRHLLDAFARVRERQPAAWLLLVGDGPEREELRLRAKRLGVAERVVFAGFRRDVEAHYALFTVSVVPSIEEGFGNVAVEAMALGVPVVASDLGGLREIIRGEHEGLLVTPGDPASLAAALLKILEDPARRRRLSGASRARSRDFSMTSYVERLEELYRRVLAGVSRSNRFRERPGRPGRPDRT